MKYHILKELMKNKNKYISGQDLSNKYGVSRTAIWKNIKKLREEGYIIESVTNKGYILLESTDILNPVEIKELLNTKFIGKEIIYRDSLDSTNNYGKALSEKGFKNGTVIIADQQTAGRGRLGRQWISQKGKGIWMTIMLKPDIKPERASQITLIAALAVLKGIKKVKDIDIKIKWPNDLVFDGKKICGILTELGGEIDKIEYLCVGIGINVNSEKRDFDINGLNTATSLKIVLGECVERKILIAEILAAFEILYNDFLENSSLSFMLEEYKNYLINVGRKVKLVSKGEEILATAEDVNEHGHLIIRKENGQLMEISSGEVSVRGVYGYI